MNIVIGNWWSNYDPNNYTPTNDSQERQLDYRRRLLREYNFTMQDKNIASWNEMPQIAATSIMAGRPAASVFVLQPDWALALYRQNLLYPVGDSRAVNWTATTPIEWNRAVTSAFTLGANSGRGMKTYAFADGYGGSYHAAVVFFNKRLFREAGLDPNLLYDLQRAGTWTWDKFVEISKQLTRDVNNDGIVDYYAMPRDLSTEILDAFVSSNGAMYVDKDRQGRLVNATTRPEFVQAVQFFMRLRDEGVMMDRPDGTNWDWHKSAFIDGRTAMFIDQQYYATNDLRNMRDEWGMVLPPKGPRVRNYVVFNDENVMVIPLNTPQAQADAIIWAVQAWRTPVDTDWKIAEYPNYRDRRAVDETCALIRNQSLWQWKFHLHVPGLNRGGIAWEIRYHEGEAAQLIEAVSNQWNALIADANGL